MFELRRNKNLIRCRSGQYVEYYGYCQTLIGMSRATGPEVSAGSRTIQTVTLCMSSTGPISNSMPYSLYLSFSTALQ